MKLKNQDITYQVYPDKGIVTAVSKNRAEILKPFYSKNIITKGVARCPPEIFNINIGKKLARARAEQKAFLQYREILQDKLKPYQLKVNEFQQNIDKVNKCISHQREYIKSF